MDALLQQIRRHRTVLEQASALEKRRQARRRADLEALLVEEYTAQITALVQRDPALGRTLEAVTGGGPGRCSLRAPPLARTLEAVTGGRLDVYSAVTQILAQTLTRP